MSHVLDKPTKIQKGQVFQPNSRSTPELDESQQAFYDFLESIEMMEGGPSSVNNKDVSLTSRINMEELPTTMDFERKGLPTNTRNDRGEPSIPNERFSHSINFDYNL